MPEPVAALPILFQSIVASNHTCGVSGDGKAYCWGQNSFGHLGDGTTFDRTIALAVAGELTFKAIAAGRMHTCGITTAGAVYCWG